MRGYPWLPKGCTCSPIAEARQRCDPRVYRCNGAINAAKKIRKTVDEHRAKEALRRALIKKGE